MKIEQFDMTKSHSSLLDGAVRPDYSSLHPDLFVQGCQEVVETAGPHWGPVLIVWESSKKQKENKPSRHKPSKTLYVHYLGSGRKKVVR